MADLSDLIRRREARLGVVGLGYVGVPVAAMLASRGFDVTGVDRDPQRVALLERGLNPIGGDEPGLDDLVAGASLKATTSYSALASADVILICVDTPVGSDHQPQLGSLEAACRSLAEVVKPGSLVVVESTIPPGTMDGRVAPLFSEAPVLLGHCPERVMPGRLLRNLRTMDRVLGAASADAAAAMRALYATFVEGELDDTDLLSAELVKTVENTYRDVNIAFANQVALICEALGADVWKVRELVRKSPGRDMLLPGPGVGGHCIPKDPWLLASALGEAASTSLIASARALNDSMPRRVAAIALGLMPAGGDRRVTLLGCAYLENSDDTRNSPSQTVAAELRRAGCEVVLSDPFVAGVEPDALTALEGADCAILMVGHATYAQLDLVRAASVMRGPNLIDTRNFFPVESPAAAGFKLRRLGAPSQSRSPG